LATIRLRRIITASAVTVALAATMASPALAAGIRVEGPKATIYQGTVRPATGSLRDNTGAVHTTTKHTALGALVRASRLKPFPLKLGWFDTFGGGWTGFYLLSINRITPPDTAGWFTKVNQKLLGVGSGAKTVGPGDRVLVYYSTFDSEFATNPTLGIGASDRTPTVGEKVTIDVAQFNDLGTRSAAANAWVWVNGVGTKTDATGHATIRLGKPGRYAVRATKQGTIRSRTVWVRASTS